MGDQKKKRPLFTPEVKVSAPGFFLHVGKVLFYICTNFEGSALERLCFTGARNYDQYLHLPVVDALKNFVKVFTNTFFLVQTAYKSFFW